MRSLEIPPPADATLLVRYRRLRALQRALHEELIEALPTPALLGAGRRLGLVQGETFVLEDEHEQSVLVDHAIYGFRRGGRTLIEERLARSLAAPGDDERELLEAMARARFSIWAVEAREPGVGVTLRDLLQGRTVRLVDEGLGATASPGLVLALRVVEVGGLCLSTGAAVLAGQADPRELGTRDFARLLQETRALPGARPEQAAELEAGALRYLLRGPATPAPGNPGPRVGRNDPCPCGSGRKRKRCHQDAPVLPPARTR